MRAFAAGCALLCLAAVAAEAWQEIRFRGLRVECPESWWALDSDKLVSIPKWMARATKDPDTLPEVSIEMAGGKRVKGRLILNAFPDPRGGFAGLRIDQFPADLEARVMIQSQWNPKVAKAFDERFQRAFQERSAPTGQQILEWSGSTSTRLNGMDALSLSYLRSGKEGAVAVEQVHIPREDAYWVVSFSYRKGEEKTWMPVVSRIRSSLHL